MPPLFGAIQPDGSSHITSSSIYSQSQYLPHAHAPPPLRSSRTRAPIAHRASVFDSLRHSIHSLFSANASTIDASTPPPLPQFTPKPAPLTLNTSSWQLPNFGFGFSDTNNEREDASPALSANFAHGEPLYEPHPVANYASPTITDVSPRLEETRRGFESQSGQVQGHGIRTPPAVYEFRRQSRLDMREMLSEAGNSRAALDSRYDTGHRRQFSGADREELILCHEISSQQKQHREKKRKQEGGGKPRKKSGGGGGGKRKNEKMWNGRYRPCLSSSKKRLRTKSIACFVAGGCLMITVATYLGLALSSSPLNSTGHVLLILLIAAITLIFCHFLLSVARLAFAKPTKKSSSPERQRGHHNRPNPRHAQRHNNNDLENAYNYTIPTHPIPITFAEEAQTSYYAPHTSTSNSTSQFRPHLARLGTADSDSNKTIPPPPPAYGIWRESVRVDPERVFWARNEEGVPDVPGRAVNGDALAALEGRGGAREGGGHGQVGGGDVPPAQRRPPSYVSDVSALSEQGDGGEERRERDTWGRVRESEGERMGEDEVEMLFVHPSLRR